MTDTPQTPPEDTPETPAEAPAGMTLDDLNIEGIAEDKDQEQSQRNEAGLEAIYDIPVRVSAVLGETQMEINQLLKLGRGAVVVLDRKIGEAIDIYINDRLVARGEVVIADEDKLGVTMTEIVKSSK